MCINMNFGFWIWNKYKNIYFIRFQDLRRDLQAKLAARTNLNIAQIEDYGGETFLSEELAINILQESKVALNRCLMVN